MQIERKSVAQIDARRRASAQALAEREPRLDSAIPRFSQSSGDVNRVAGTRAIAPQSVAARHRAADHHIAVDLISPLCARSPPASAVPVRFANRSSPR